MFDETRTINLGQVCPDCEFHLIFGSLAANTIDSARAALINEATGITRTGDEWAASITLVKTEWRTMRDTYTCAVCRRDTPNSEDLPAFHAWASYSISDVDPEVLLPTATGYSVIAIREEGRLLGNIIPGGTVNGLFADSAVYTRACADDVAATISAYGEFAAEPLHF